MTVSENIYIKWDVVLPCKQEFSFISLTCVNAHAHDIHMHAHTQAHIPIYICMLPELNINLINHKNKDVTSYGAGDVKMYHIYQLSKDFHLSKD